MLALCLDSVSFRGFCEFKILRTLTLVAPETWILYSKQTTECKVGTFKKQRIFDDREGGIFWEKFISDISVSYFTWPTSSDVTDTGTDQSLCPHHPMTRPRHWHRRLLLDVLDEHKKILSFQFLFSKIYLQKSSCVNILFLKSIFTYPIPGPGPDPDLSNIFCTLLRLECFDTDDWILSYEQ